LDWIGQQLNEAWNRAIALQQEINRFANNAQQAVFNGFVGLLPQVQENPMVSNPQNLMFANYQGQLYINPAVGSTAFGLAAIMAGGETAASVGGRALQLLDRADIKKLSLIERQEILKSIQNDKLRNVFDSLYREKDVLPGGTAGAIKYENITGDWLSPSSHSIKGNIGINTLNNILKNSNLINSDKLIAEKMLAKLNNAE